MTMTVRCSEMREMLPAYRDGELSLAVRRHLSRCALCRADLGRYEAIGAAAAGLRALADEPGPELLPALLAIPRELSRTDALRIHLARNRAAYLGGVAVAAGAVGALWKVRRGRLATA